MKNEDEVRLIALELANEHGEHTLKRAEDYLRFLNGESVEEIYPSKKPNTVKVSVQGDGATIKKDGTLDVNVKQLADNIWNEGKSIVALKFAVDSGLVSQEVYDAIDRDFENRVLLEKVVYYLEEAKRAGLPVSSIVEEIVPRVK
jgi:hypothetical protein